jgi:hypothetical protein
MSSWTGLVQQIGRLRSRKLSGVLLTHDVLPSAGVGLAEGSVPMASLSGGPCGIVLPLMV